MVSTSVLNKESCVQAWAADASLRNGEDRTSTPKSDGGSAFTSPTKSISLDRFDRSYSISSRATPLHLDPSFSAQSLSSRDSLSTSASVTDFSATPSSELSITSSVDIYRSMTWVY